MKGLKDLVSRVYYTHGLFCASHPFSILVSVCAIIIFLCYPLLYVPLPGNIPAEYVTPLKNYKVPPKSSAKREKSLETQDVTSIPRWYKGPSRGYIQQIVVKATVSPWEPTQHDPLDALYAPLTKVFKTLDEVEKLRHQHGKGEKSLVDCCLRVSEPLRSKHTLLPEYACLILSPANLWQKNLNRFLEDKEVLRTIHKRYNQALDAPPGIRDVLFGLPWRQTGISRYFIRNRQRTISFAITLVLKSCDESFVSSLRKRLEAVYPDTLSNVNNTEVNQIVHLHYKDINIYFEYIHLIVLYLVLLMYLYFSVKKIELVKSKWGLALSAVVTVVSSLLISVSVCSIFGLTTRINGGEIFPYLVVLIGVENVLVMTKSVVSTSVELDVRYRVATGLSKEGWYITKNLLIELVIIFVGFFTFVPAIQEFCMFAMVGLLTDFTLQMVFFVTVLSVDIRRMELSDLHRHKQDTSPSPSDLIAFEPLIKCPFKTHLASDRVRFQTRINLSSGIGMISSQGAPVSPRVQHEERLSQREPFLDLPRRLRLLYFWASTRVVQRFIMVCSVIWIVLIVYKTGLVHHITNTSFNGTVVPDTVDDLEQIISLQEQTTTTDNSKMEVLSPLAYFWRQDDEDLGSVKHTDLETWKKLSHVHWVTLFGYYNISIVGKYISILPSIHLSVIIPPEEAIRLRVPGYKTNWPQNEAKVRQLRPPKIPEVQQNTKLNKKTETKKENEEEKIEESESGIESIHQTSSEQYPKIALEPDFLSEEYLRKYYPYIDPEQLKQYYPKSRLEFIITVSLAFLSVICITYFVMVMYRCMCSKKYSKWRASWNKIPKNSKGNSYYKQMKEAVPIVLKGHLQEIECLIIDGSVIISSCLGGQLRVWDSVTGECLHMMQRKSATPPMRRKPCEGRNVEDSDADLYAEYHGNHSNQFNSSTDLDLSGGQCDQPKPRLRRISGRSDNEQNSSQSSDRFEQFPDLKNTIDFNFSSMYRNKITGNNSLQSGENVAQENVTERRERAGKEGYDFQNRFNELYSEHEKFLEEKQQHEDIRRQYLDHTADSRASRSKSWSEGDHTFSDTSMNDSSNLELSPSPIWCLACRGNLVIAGCGNGKVEFWDTVTGALKCLYGESEVGVTGINFVGKKVIVARIDGSIDFLELETFQNPKISTPLSPSSLNLKIKGHSRHLSHTRTGSDDLRLWDEVIHCTQVQHTQAHQRSITVLLTEGGRIISGSQDFTLKVFRLEDYRCLYTLHGHRGSITCLYLDKCPPYAAVSGSADGTIRLWDLLTGHCVHKVIGHEGTIVGLTCTDMYIISSGMDDKMCVWERKRGHLLYSVEMETSCGITMAMLCKNFLVTGGQGSLYLWDVHKGELVRVVSLQHRDHTAFIHHIQSMENSTIVCDYGKDIKVIHFPLVLEKRD